MSTPNEMQRWELELGWNYEFGFPFPKITEHPAGDYVLWSDIEPLIRSHEALREALAGLTLALDRMTHSSDWLPGDKQRAAWAAREQAKAALAAAKEVAQPTRAARE